MTNTVYVCNKCHKEYKSKGRFDSHECIQIFKCESCGYKTVHEEMFKKHVCPTFTKVENTYKAKCPYCNATFAREKTLITHMCKKKERYLNKNTKETLLAFEMWSKFRDFIQITVAANTSPMDVFLESQEFEAFYKFATYALETKLIKPLEFMKHALRSGTSIDIWTTTAERKKWIVQYLKGENAISAVERSIVAVNEWSLRTGYDWKTFFQNVSSERFIQLLSNGDISPWFIYASSTYNNILDRLSDNEFMELVDYMDPRVWKVKQHKSKEEFLRIQEVCKEFGI